MVQVQVNIAMTKDTIEIPVHILSREDATDDERTIAHAVEQAVLALNRAVMADCEDAAYTEELIGSQHDGERQRLALLAVAQHADRVQAHYVGSHHAMEGETIALWVELGRLIDAARNLGALIDKQEKD